MRKTLRSIAIGTLASIVVYHTQPSARAANEAEPDVEPHVETLVDTALRDFLHSEFLLTLNGQKPFSVVERPPNLDFPAAFNALQSQGVFNNSDIGWFFPKNSDRTIAFYSRKAITALLSDPERIETLHELGFPETRTTDETVQAFRRVWERKQTLTSENYDAIVGILLGFPMQDALAYSGLLFNGDQQQGVEVKLFPKTTGQPFKGSFIEHPKTPAREAHALIQKGVEAVSKYQVMSETGMTALDIINGWDAKDAGATYKVCRGLFVSSQ